jgi:hypothetical protein
MKKGLISTVENKNLWLIDNGTPNPYLEVLDEEGYQIDVGEVLIFDNKEYVADDELESCNGIFTETYFYKIEAWE